MCNVSVAGLRVYGERVYATEMYLRLLRFHFCTERDYWVCSARDHSEGQA